MKTLFIVFCSVLLIDLYAGGSTAAKDHYAVIIGVDEYKNRQSGLSGLKFVKNDVTAVYELLLSLGWDKTKIKTISGKTATKRNLSALFNGWLRRIKQSDILLVYWAGHGYPDLADQRKVYFACYDTDLKTPWTGYRMDKVVKTIRDHKIRNVIFVADTCHAGKIVTRSNGTKGLSIQPYIENVPVNRNIPEGWIFMAATEAGSQTIENAKWKNGVFTHCFVKAVKKNTTLRDVKDKLLKEVPVEAARITDMEIRPIIVTTSGKQEIWDMTLHLNGGEK